MNRRPQTTPVHSRVPVFLCSVFLVPSLIFGAACGGRNDEAAEETTGGDTVVTDEAWEASAWEPEPEPEVAESAESVEAWTIETWRSTLDERASGCDAIPSWTSLHERADAYATMLEAGESPETLLTAHEEVITLLGEWERECTATAPSR